MPDPMNPAAPADRARPASVSISSYLLFLVAAMLVVNALAGLSSMGPITDVYRDAYRGTPAEGAEGLIVAVAVGTAVLWLLFAAAFVVLALLNNRGKNPARIVTWALGGISLCCGGLNLAGSAIGNSMRVRSTRDMPDPAQVQRQLENALPSWIGPVTIAAAVIMVIALLVALILLALPPSNEFFRKPQAAWEPPLPGSAYPAYPPVMPPATGPTGPPYNPPGPPYNPPTPPSNPPTPPAS